MKRKMIYLAIFLITLFSGAIAVYYINRSNSGEVVFGEGEAKYKTRLEAAPTDGSTPADYDSNLNIAYMLYQLKNGENFTSTTKGAAISVGQTQDIYNRKIKNGDEYLIDTLSSGLLVVGKQKFFSENKVLMRDFVSKDDNYNITWSTNEPVCLSYNGYIKMYGSLPSDPSSYIICDETILSISELSKTEDGFNTISIDLNPGEEYAPFWYRREIAINSSSITVPEFKSIKIEYVFDDKWVVQRIRTQEEYKITPKVAPITVECQTDITEIFDYDNYEFPSSDMDYFKQYKDMTPSDGGDLPAEEETALSYITSSLMTGGEKTFDIKLNINDELVTGKVGLDISDLNNIKVRLKVDKLQVVFENNTVYIDLGDTKIKANINDITSLLGSTSVASEGEGLSLDVNQIMNDLNNAVIVETETHVEMDVKLNLLGLELPIKFVILKTEAGYDMEKISTNISLEGINVGVELSKTAAYEFLPTTGEYNDIANLGFVIEEVMNIINNKSLGLQISLNYKGIIVSGDILVDFNEVLKIEANLDVQYNEISEDVYLVFIDNVVYLEYENIKVSLPVSELERLINFEELLPTEAIDLNQILGLVFSIDFADIIDNLVIKEDSLSTTIKLTQFVEGLESITINVNDLEEGIAVAIDLLDINLIINSNIDKEIIAPTEYTDLTGYVGIVEYLMGIINQESMRIGIDGNINIGEINVNMEGNIDLVLEETYKVNGELTVSIDDITLKVGVKLIGNDLYVNVIDKTIKIDLTTIGETINTIMSELGVSLDMDMSSMDINVVDILAIVDKINITSDTLSVDLSSLVEFIGVLSVKVALDSSLDVEVKANGINVGVNVSKIESYPITVPTDYIDEQDILNVIPYVKDVMEIINNGHVGIELEASYNDININGNVYVDFNNGIALMATLDVKYNDITEKANVWLVENVIYLEYRNIKVSLPLSEITKFITTSEMSIDINAILSVVKEVLSTLKITDTTISLDVCLEELLNIEQTLNLTLINQDYGFDLSLNLLDIYIKVDTNVVEEIIAPTEYTDLTGYVGIVEY